MFEPLRDRSGTKQLPPTLRLIDGLKRGSSLTTGTPPVATGWDELDSALGGGLPGRKLTELVAPQGGKASLLFSLAAATTQSGRNLAWIDPACSLDIDGAKIAGIVLDRVLWVRPRTTAQAFRAADLVLGSDGFAVAVLDLVGAGERRLLAGDRLLLDAAAWNRLARRTEASGVALVICTERPMAAAAAALRLDVRIGAPCWMRDSTTAPLTLEGAGVEVEVSHRKGGPAGFVGRFRCRR